MFEEILALRRYSFLLKQLIRRDFKTRYRGSALGVLWSVLNPLLNMLVLSCVFSQIFRQVENYMLYVLSGITVFSFFSESTQQGLSSVVANFGLFGKVKVPRVIFPVAKVLSTSINLVITALIFLIMSWCAGIAPTWNYLLIPVILVLVCVFAAGMSMLLSALNVFFRDTQHLYSVICTIWMYVTPVLYPLETTIPEQLHDLFRCNPMYHFVLFFRDVAFYGQTPNITTWAAVLLWSAGMFCAGLYFFYKRQDDFIYYN